MPELPEVEVTRRGLAPHLEGRVVTAVTFRRSGLRWPFPTELVQQLPDCVIRTTGRRGKYLLLEFDQGTLIIHLGMSGHLRLLPAAAQAGVHDHFDLVIGSQLMRLTDPRRFGAVLWHGREQGPVVNHPLLASLGVEPFDYAFTGEFLYQKSRNRTADIKQTLLSGKIVVGVGNIYASESLFLAGINPKTQARRIGRQRYEKLAAAIRTVLASAIEQGGSSLRDFSGINGQPGYFQLVCNVYGRQGEACRICGTTVSQIKQGQRSTFYCVNCQK